MRTLSDRSAKVLPLLYETCDIPHIIADLRYADFRSDYSAGLREILHSIQPSPHSKTIETNDQPHRHHTLQLSSLRAIAAQAIEEKRAVILETRLYDLGAFEKEEEVGPTTSGTQGLARYFSNGVIVWHDYGKHARKSFAVYGAIGYRFRDMARKWRGLGFPITDEQDAPASPFGATGRCSLFEDGVVLWYDSGSYREQTYAISGQIARKYNALGLSGSYLGFPISDPYPISVGKRCDFEGGAIIFLESNESIQIVRQLLRISYLDSPFNHQWGQYSGPTDPDCLSVRLATGIGNDKSYIAFNSPWRNKAVLFPDSGFQPGELREKYCCVTIKSLVPGGRVRFYIKVKTNGVNDQYLEFDSQITQKEFVANDKENVSYWRVPLPEVSTDGQWHSYIIDLDSHIQEGFTRTLESLQRLHFREHVGIADLLVSDSREALEALVLNPSRV
jgi:hypothetical protein